MNQSFKALLVFVSLFSLPCVAQRPSQGPMQLREDERAPVAQIQPKALLVASNGTDRAEFGESSAINRSGDTIVVGAPIQNGFQGGVYVFVKPITGWVSATQTTQLAVSGPPSIAQLGFAVAISSDGNTIAASSPDTGNGTVYVFSPTGGSWSNGGTVVAELTTPDIGAVMGNSLAISGDGQTIVAGASSADGSEGAVYVYGEPSGGWTNMTPTAKLTVAAPHPSQALGYSVAIAGDTIVAGAEDYLGSSGGSGEVYVFSKPASGWANGTQTAELLASDASAGDALGFSVGISGNTIVGGAPFHSYGSTQYQGALYVFVEPTSGWANAFQNAELTASNSNQDATLGTSVAMSGSLIIGGAPLTGSGVNAHGEVCVYVKPGSGWANGTETYDLNAATGQLGWSVSLTSTGPVAISGSLGGKGRVFVFEK